jgi:hypothetical protein
MAHGGLTELIGAGGGHAPSRPTPRLWLTVRYRLTAWWVRVLVIFVVSRVVSTTILLAFAAKQPANAWTGAHPGYLDFAKMWDGHWYFIIAAVGYPQALPVTTDGHVGESAWAFMPAYPFLVRALMFVTGLDFRVVAVAVSLAFALGTALMFYKLMNLVLPGGTALFAVVLYSFAPLSPLLQVAYAESMHAFFLTLALYLLVRRDYWRLLPVVVVMSLTRPSGLAFALALGLHVVYRWVTRERDPFARRDIVASVTVGAVSVVSGFAWLVIAAAVTGSPTAYTDTELAWRSAYIGYQQLVPFTPWLLGADFWAPGPLGVVLLVAAVGAFAALMFSRPVRRLGPDIQFWVASYVLYLLAVFFPQSSTFRLLLPVFPLWGALAQPRSWVYRLALVGLCVAGQVGWVYIAWWVDGYDWTPP